MYKNKYAIGIYNKIKKVGDTDDLVSLLETADEFAKFVGKSIKIAYSILWNHLKGNQSDITIKGKTYEIAFIDMSEE